MIDNNEDLKYMKLALFEAEQAAKENEVPVGAVVVCKGQVLARTHNQTERLTDITAHAEMLALTAAQDALGAKYLTDCTLYVTVEPCTMCAGAIGWAQLGRLVYGAADEKRGYTKIAPSALHPRTEVAQGLLEEECGQLMKSFFKQKRRS